MNRLLMSQSKVIENRIHLNSHLTDKHLKKLVALLCGGYGELHHSNLRRFARWGLTCSVYPVMILPT